MRSRLSLSLSLLGLSVLAACSSSAPGRGADPTQGAALTASVVQGAAPRAPGSTPPAASALGYPWSAEPPSPSALAATVADRFTPPRGFDRIELRPGSFGSWLRGLPLEAPGAAVRSFSGRVILPPDHENLAAVVALDVGTGDLQQCADSVIRLHAEWLFAQGRRDASYRAASGAEMPFARWARGERMVPEGQAFAWTKGGRADASHASYRRWLESVFAWANTGSLARDTERVQPGELRPGDFVVQPGGPGHAVLVIDEARAADGRRALLLAQGFMPAQSFHVLRPSRASAWFIVEPGALGLDTPFWPVFPWKTLHRFAGT